ncbi:MAG: M24 family metallopeptidase, partial [Lachnospiraceae bacterium]|nr:M24 family metallopeptidase [Lachnospiraceae bacterium]
FDLPGYLVDALRSIVGNQYMENCCDLFIGGENGARIINNANEIAHYEYGSALASDGVFDALNRIREGITELELGNCLNRDGQRNSVVTVAAAGQRFKNANLYPTENRVKLGDPISLTAGYKGGLSSRAGYAVEKEEQLPEQEKDYIKCLAGPYFAAVVTWLEQIRIGMEGRELYQKMEKVLPKERYHWELNPGHLAGDEEWMSSPISPSSKDTLKSGMLLQIDIIPGIQGYAGASCESGVALADADLRKQICREYPNLYEVFMKRRNYMRNTLNINLPEEVLPMNDTVAYYRPFFLNRGLAFVKGE